MSLILLINLGWLESASLIKRKKERAGRGREISTTEGIKKKFFAQKDHEEVEWRKIIGKCVRTICLKFY